MKKLIKYNSLNPHNYSIRQVRVLHFIISLNFRLICALLLQEGPSEKREREETMFLHLTHHLYHVLKTHNGP